MTFSERFPNRFLLDTYKPKLRRFSLHLSLLINTKRSASSSHKSIIQKYHASSRFHKDIYKRTKGTRVNVLAHSTKSVGLYAYTERARTPKGFASPLFCAQLRRLFAPQTRHATDQLSLTCDTRDHNTPQIYCR